MIYIKKGGDLYVKKERPQAPQEVAPPGIGKEVVTDEGIGKVLKVNHHKQYGEGTARSWSYY